MSVVRSSSVRLKWSKGDSILLKKGQDTRGELLTLVGRVSDAYVFESQNGKERRPITDFEIYCHRLDGEIVHYPSAPMGLSEAQHALLTAEFDSHIPEYRLVAEIRVEYCRQVDRLREKGSLRIEDCCKQAAEDVLAEHAATWEQRFTEIETIRAADARHRSQLPMELKNVKEGPGQRGLGRRLLEKVTPVTVENWWRLWVSVGRDRRILVPLFEKRGNRVPRLRGRKGVDLYQEMRDALKTLYYVREAPPLSVVLKRLNTQLSKTGNCVSYHALNDLRRREFSPYEEHARRSGLSSARMRYDVFQRISYDMPALEEIEIDHCLLDIIVVHEKSGRALGRPWLTMAIDRSTRMIVGVHISFEVPSFASLQRCLMHAMWPKDLRGLGLKNPWPCEGIPRRVIVDNGKEFHSTSLHSAELALDFSIRYLPGRSPYLKGIIERSFGTLQGQVLSWQEGKTFCNTRKRDDYNSVKKARTTLSDLRRDLLHWIVDDYHVAHHSGIDSSPLDKWYEKVPEDGFRAVPDAQSIIGLLGSAREKPIGRTGVRLYGHHYWHPELKALRRFNGENHRYQIRSDPYDIGSIQLLHPKGSWIVLNSDRPELADGVTVHQNRVRRGLARKLAQPGSPVEEHHYMQAASVADEESQSIIADHEKRTTARKVARYEQDNGQFFTPVAGSIGSRMVANDDREGRRTAPRAAVGDEMIPNAERTEPPKKAKKRPAASRASGAAMSATAKEVEDDFAARLARTRVAS